MSIIHVVFMGELTVAGSSSRSMLGSLRNVISSESIRRLYQGSGSSQYNSVEVVVATFKTISVC